MAVKPCCITWLHKYNTVLLITYEIKIPKARSCIPEHQSCNIHIGDITANKASNAYCHLAATIHHAYSMHLTGMDHGPKRYMVTVDYKEYESV